MTDITVAGAVEVLREASSGTKAERDRLRKAVGALEAGYVLMATRLNLLARSTSDLLNTLARISDRKAGYRSLGGTWTDTTSSRGQLMVTALGELAEFERDLIRARRGERLRRVIARGVKMRPKAKMVPHQIKEAIRRRDRGEETLREIASSYNVSHSTISRLMADV